MGTVKIDGEKGCQQLRDRDSRPDEAGACNECRRIPFLGLIERERQISVPFSYINVRFGRSPCALVDTDGMVNSILILKKSVMLLQPALEISGSAAISIDCWEGFLAPGFQSQIAERTRLKTTLSVPAGDRAKKLINFTL
jgi:hypothetical protein